MRLTEQQLQETLDAVEKYGGIMPAATALGIPKSTFCERVQKAKDRLLDKIPEGQMLKGTSVLYDKDGNEKLKWIKTDRDLDKQREIIAEVVEAMKGDIKPIKLASPPRAVNSDLMAEYILTDFHLGMLAEAKESGADWNMEIAEQTVAAWLMSAIDSVPNAHTGVFVNLGDFHHFSSMVAETPTHRNPLDAACRPNTLIKAAIRIMRRCIDMLLGKHQHVHVVIADANHDPYGQAYLRECLAVLYEKEPRITIDQTESTYYCYEWGDVSTFYHHGHKKNLKQVTEVFVGTFREIFGRTKYSYGKIGHYHHKASTENCLMQTEIMPTLAPKDAHAASSGYLSNRAAITVVYHKKYGEVKRITTSPEMVL